MCSIFSADIGTEVSNSTCPYIRKNVHLFIMFTRIVLLGIMILNYYCRLMNCNQDLRALNINSMRIPIK